MFDDGIEDRMKFFSVETGICSKLAGAGVKSARESGALVDFVDQAGDEVSTVDVGFPFAEQTEINPLLLLYIEAHEQISYPLCSDQRLDLSLVHQWAHEHRSL